VVGSGQCGHNSAAFGAQYWIICSEITGQRVVRAFRFRTVRPPIRLATPPMGDEVALFSAARHSGIPETKATVKPRAFGCGCAALRKKLVVEAAQVRFWLARGEAQKCSRGVVLVRGCLRCANCMGLAPWLWLVVCDRGSSRQISEQSRWPFNRSLAQTKEQ